MQITAARFTRFRKALKVTQRELAAMIGVSHSYVGHIEAGIRPVTERVEHELLMIWAPREKRALLYGGK